MASFSISTTSSSITVDISNMNTYYWNKHFTFEIRESSMSQYWTVADYTKACNGTQSYTYSGLQSSTTYYIRVNIQMQVGTEFQSQQTYTSSSITTDSGGGGGGGNPTFSVSVSGSNIYVTVSDYGSNPAVHAYLYDNLSDAIAKNNNDKADSYENDYQCVIQAPSSGTYYVVCHYMDDNTSWIWLQDYYGDTQIEVTVESGPTPTEDWHYDSIYPISVSQSVSPIIEPYNFYAKDGVFFTFILRQSGTLNVYSSEPGGGPLKSYFGPTNSGYRTSSGQPYDYDYYDTGSFNYTAAGDVDDRYYLWVNSVNGSSFTLNIVFTPSAPPVQQWEYYFDRNYSISSITQISESVTNYEGERFRVSFNYDGQATFQIISGSGYIYITDSYNSWNSNTGAPYTDSGQTQEATGSSTSLSYNVLSLHGYYHVWVRGITGSYSGTIVIRITPPPAPVVNTGYVYIYIGSGTNQGWKKAIPYIYTGSGANQGWKQAQAYIYNGSQWKKTTE